MRLVILAILGNVRVAAQTCPETRSEWEKLKPKITETTDAVTISTSTCPMYIHNNQIRCHFQKCTPLHLRCQSFHSYTQFMDCCDRYENKRWTNPATASINQQVPFVNLVDIACFARLCTGVGSQLYYADVNACRISSGHSCVSQPTRTHIHKHTHIHTHTYTYTHTHERTNTRTHGPRRSWCPRNRRSHRNRFQFLLS